MMLIRFVSLYQFSNDYEVHRYQEKQNLKLLQPKHVPSRGGFLKNLKMFKFCSHFLPLSLSLFAMLIDVVFGYVGGEPLEASDKNQRIPPKVYLAVKRRNLSLVSCDGSCVQWA